MKQTILYALPLLGAAVALPAIHKREVPQEHAHQNIIDIIDPLLQQNNPDKIQSSVFGLLGAKAAAEGAGNIKDTDCLQQATADQAFTNAKAAGDVAGQTAALVYRALERNSGTVGGATNACTSIKAVNPEIAAIQQHQDPAGAGAQASNKAIAQTLVQQIASIGGDVTQANEASTFAPGKIGDPTAKGNTCDVADDKAGCINSQNLRVNDLSDAEIAAAAGNATVAAANATAPVVAAAAGNSTADAAAKKKGDKKKDDKKKNDKKKGDKKKDDKKKDDKKKDDKKKDDKKKDDKKKDDKKKDDKKKGNAGAAAAANNATAPVVAAAAAPAAPAAAGAAKCNLDVKFGAVADRSGDAFEAADLQTFPHGSALNIGVISDFICQQAGLKCGLSAAQSATCDSASTAAKALKAQAAADSFNSAVAAFSN